VSPPILLDTPILLVKPPVGLPTPAIFKQLDLDGLSLVDPTDLLREMQSAGSVTQNLAVNDLEPPAFTILPELGELKERLIAEGSFQAVFMTGSGSTIVCFGSDDVPAFLSEEKYRGLFVSPCRLISRKPGEWYTKSQYYSKATM